MIDILPSPRSAIFIDTRTRKLPRSFYWGAAVALLFHAGLAYYLVQQNFNLAAEAPPEEGPTIVIDNTPPPSHPRTQTPQKPVNPVVVHTPLDPVTKTADPVALTSQKGVETSLDGPPQIVADPPVAGPVAGTGTDAGPTYVTPRWKAFPDAATLTDYYPPRALDNEIEGSASVQCTVLDAGGRVHCTIVSETPKGYGFGQQTVKMVEEKGRVDTSAGDIKVGSVLATTTVKWQLN